MLWFDEGDLIPWLAMGMVQLMIVVLIAGSVARVVIRQRAREYLFRIRIARWRAAMAAQEAAGPRSS